MKLEQFDDDDGFKVWLAKKEVDQLLGGIKDTQRYIGVALAARCGLRAAEVIDVLPTDVVDTPVGPRVRVREGKGDKYREVPAPERLVDRIGTFADVRDDGRDVPLVDVTTRTLGRWVDDAAARQRVETGEDSWKFLTPHDLRRTWGTILLGEGVLPHVVKDWGGWESWETFEKHYLGAASPEVERREIGKVDWL